MKKKVVRQAMTVFLAVAMIAEPLSVPVFAVEDTQVISEGIDALSDNPIIEDVDDGIRDEALEDPQNVSDIIVDDLSLTEKEETEHPADETEKSAEDISVSVSENSTVSDNTLSENSVSENSVSENSVSDNSIDDISLSENVISENEIGIDDVILDDEAIVSVNADGISDVGSVVDANNSNGTPGTPEITAVVSKDEKTATVTISVPVGYICYTLNGKNPGYKDGMPLSGTTCERKTSCSFKIQGKSEYTILAMNVTPNGKSSKVAKKVVVLEPNITKLGIDGPTRVVPGKTAAYTAKTTPSYRKPKNLEWSLDFPNGSAIQEYVTINSKSGKVTVKKNNITTSAITLCNNPIFYVYTTAIEEGTVIKSGKYTVTLAAVASVRSMKFNNKSITLNRGKSDKTYKKTDDAYRGKFSSGLIIYSPNDDDPMSDTDIANNIVFSSSDDSVATVDKYGNITAKKAGKAKITAVSDDRLKKASMIVTVIQEITSNPTINSLGNRFVIATGKKMQLSASGSPQDAKMSISWNVSPAGYGVTVNKKGLVSVSKKASAGKYTITAYDSISKKEGRKDVTVVTSQVTKINMSEDAKNLLISRTGNNNTATYSVFFDNNCTEYAVTTNKPGLVSVSAKDIKGKGCKVTVKATGYASGTAKVTVTATDGSNKSVTSTISVINEDFSIELTQSKNIKEMYTGTSVTLTGTVYNSNRKKISRKVSWGISPAGQGVTVSGGGKVSASKNAKGGKYTVFCSINDQLQCASYEMTVNPRCTQIMVGNDYDPKTNKITSVYSVGLNSSPSSKLEFYNGMTKIAFKPVDSQNPVKIKNTKSNVAGATISYKNGNYYLTLSGRSKGTTQITLTANDGSKTTRTFKVNVE